MTKHKHYDLIVAKAANMELVVFSKSNVGINGGVWSEVPNQRAFPSCESEDHFLCLPQHAGACLHWLNGGEVECRSNLVGKEWSECYPLGKWHAGLGLMRDDAEYRIKPRKEKRWIIIRNERPVRACFDSNVEAVENSIKDDQIIEIEVEV